MARFEKFRSKTGVVSWYLILEDFLDVVKYMDVDVELMIQETVCVASQHTNKGYVIHASTVSGRIAENLVGLVEISNKPLPELLASVSDSKMKGMLSIINEGKAVCVNHNRGYSDLEGMCDIWDFESLQVLPAEKPYSFPINDSVAPPHSQHLILENAPKANSDLKESFGLGEEENVGIITSLKEQSREYLLEAISYAEIIYFRTMAVDAIQNAQMAEFFLALPEEKEIVIDSCGYLARQTITNLASFDQLSQKHKIRFIK